jgi:transcription elongation factor B subunit 1
MNLDDVAAAAAPVEEKREYVKLKSNDGFEFVLEKAAACQSKMIKEMLDATAHYDDPSIANTIPFEDISANVLDLVCQYLSERYNASSGMNEFAQLKAFDPKNELDRQTILELLLAADYLDC